MNSETCVFYRCMRVTNSTTYSMVGALNKLPIAVSGLIFFNDTPITVSSVGSIVVGFISGIIYTVFTLISCSIAQTYCHQP